MISRSNKSRQIIFLVYRGSQAEVDCCTHIVDKKYPDEEWVKFTPTEKQRLYQIRHGSKGAGRDDGRRSSSSVSEAGTKGPPDNEHDYNGGEYDQTNDSKRNRDNDALKKSPPSGRQVGFKTEK